MRHPEWAGYLAAFDAYVDARRRGDVELADQARMLMSHFAEALIEVGLEGRPCGGSPTRVGDDLAAMLDALGLG